MNFETETHMKQPKKISTQKGKAAGALRKVALRKLPTGVRGLDDILGGGLPELSFNIIAGAPDAPLSPQSAIWRNSGG